MPKNTVIYGETASGKSLMANVLAMHKTRLSDSRVLIAETEPHNTTSMLNALFDDAYRVNVTCINALDNPNVVHNAVNAFKPKVTIIDTLDAVFLSNHNPHQYGTYIAQLVNDCNNNGSDVIILKKQRVTPMDDLRIFSVLPISATYKMMVKPTVYESSRIVFPNGNMEFNLKEFDTDNKPTRICTLTRSNSVVEKLKLIF